MTNQFDWDFEEINEEAYQEIAPEEAASYPVWLYVLMPILLLAGGSYWFIQTQFQKLSDTQIASLTSLIDTQKNALADKDFDLYFSLANASDAWKIQQLEPANRAFFASNPTIKDISEEGSELWVTLAGEVDNEPVARTLFFSHSQGVATAQIGSSLIYWGDDREVSFEWGTLILNERDRVFEDDIVETIESAIGEFEGEIIVEVVTDGKRPFSPNTLHIPSPRLIALTPNGDLSAFYRTQLSDQVAKFAVPKNTPIRFAIPDDPFITYTSLADAFTAETGIPVDLITIAEDNDDFLEHVDAAAISPTVDLIVDGHLYDLTDFVFDDAEFQAGDFYSEFWDGASWRERIWMIPQEAEMNVLLYARDAYRQRELAFPTANWTWDDMAAQTKALAEPSDARYEIGAGILSATSDLLYAYAFSNFSDRLNQEAIDATLDWYRTLEATNRAVPLSQINNDADREYESLQQVSYPPKVGFWTASPNTYEYFIQYLPIGVLPFPASTSAPSSPPLYVTGHVMSSAAQNPYNTWAWLKFLSYNPPIRLDNRHIPARNSVANTADYWPQLSINDGVGFWPALPEPIGEVMRKTFADAQAVPLDKQDVFSWEAIAKEPASEDALRQLETNDAVAAKYIPPKITVASARGMLSQPRWHPGSKSLMFHNRFPDYNAGETGWLTYAQGNSVAEPIAIDPDLLAQIDTSERRIIGASPTGETVVVQDRNEDDEGLAGWWIVNLEGDRYIGRFPAISLLNTLTWSQDNKHFVIEPSETNPFPDDTHAYIISIETGHVQPIQLNEPATFSAISANATDIIFDYGSQITHEYGTYNIGTGEKKRLNLPTGSRNPQNHENSLLIKDFSRCTADKKETFRISMVTPQKVLLEIPCESGLFFGDFSLSPNSCTLAYTVEDLRVRQYSLVLAALC